MTKAKKKQTATTNSYRFPYIENKKLYFRILAIDDFVDGDIHIKEHHKGMVIDGEFLIAKTKPLFHPLGLIDWAHFTPKDLASAINSRTVTKYYKKMLKDPMSPANNWKDKKLEKELKDFYKQRAKEAKS